MSGRRVGQKVFDWGRIAARVPQEAKAEFGAFRARHEACRASLSALPEKPDPINWDYYRQRISQPGLVDNFQKQFEAVSVPYPKDNVTSMMETQKTKIEAQVTEALQESKKTIADLRSQLDKINAEKPYEDMTIDEYLSDKPELKRQIDQDTRNHVWYLGRD